jgi:hypothetical protein
MVIFPNNSPADNVWEGPTLFRRGLLNTKRFHCINVIVLCDYIRAGSAKTYLSITVGSVRGVCEHGLYVTYYNIEKKKRSHFAL